jgi:hypothetical protein
MVQKMANEKRLIDANALKGSVMKEIRHYWNEGEGGYYLAEDVIPDIDLAPTVDAVEVVHGRWVFGTANHREWMKCSECLVSQTPTGVFTYCPNCGAKMDGDGK